MDVVVCHLNADFDSLGGLVGAGRLYPDAALVSPGGQSPAVRDFLALHCDAVDIRGHGDIDPTAITRVVVVDTARRRRLGPAAAWLDLPDVEVHRYDHHGEGDILSSGGRCEDWGSASTIIAHCLRERALPVTPIVATVLLLGIYEDTGSLMHAGTAAEDLEAAAWLRRSGGDLSVVRDFLVRPLHPDQRRLLSELLDRVEIHEVRGRSVAIAEAVPGPYVGETAVLAGELLDILQTAAVFVLAPVEGTTHVIGRSGAAIDLREVLSSIGGGGHARAASAAVASRTPGEIRSDLLEAIDQHAAPEVTAREIMSHPVRTIGADVAAADARSRMIRYGHSGLVVTDGERLAGIVTRRDVDRARHHRLAGSPVRGFMIRDVVTAGPDAPVSELESIMLRAAVGRIPILKEGRIVGIVTRTDLLRALHGARYLAGTRPMGEETVRRLLRERAPAAVQRLLEQIGQTAARQEAEAYIVGGFVRDLLLHHPNTDLDVLVEPDAAALARAFAREAGGDVKVHARFGTAAVVLPSTVEGHGMKVEFATARTESYAAPGALPQVEDSSIVDDLRRRDFTINAMAIALRPERFGDLLDPFGGMDDIERRRLRVLHVLSFTEDPTRVFRAVRFEERFNFRMDAGTEALARQALEGDALSRISPDRLRRELYLTLRDRRAVGSLLRLSELGLFRWLDPEITIEQTGLVSVAAALGWWRKQTREGVRSEIVYLAAILLPLGRRGVHLAETRLGVPAPELALLAQALDAPARLSPLEASAESPSDTVRALAGLKPEALVTLCARLSASDTELSAPRAALDRFITGWRHTKLEITGEDLKSLGYPPGPALGDALRATLDAKLDGELNGREDEIRFAVRHIEQSPRPSR